MTRVLSELLGAEEPMFHHDLVRLESASGRSSADIRLTTEVERATRSKLRELGLDPSDTTGLELYRALQARVKADDERLSATLKAKYGDEHMHASISKALHELPVAKSCFALKTSVAKRLLKRVPPKQTMKILGYRSFDSMLRREQLLAIFAAAWLVESATWRKSLVDSYKKLQASDFEIRHLTVLGPDTPHWQALASLVVLQKKHTVVGLKELGAIVILPFPETPPPA